MQFRCIRRCAVALLLLVLFAPVALARQDAMVLPPGLTETSLAAQTAYRHDSTGSDTPEDAFRRTQAGQFAPLPGGKSNFGFERGAYWFHVRLLNDNPREPRWMLVQRYALSDRIDVYARYPDGRVLHQASGD